MSQEQLPEKQESWDMPEAETEAAETQAAVDALTDAALDTSSLVLTLEDAKSIIHKAQKLSLRDDDPILCTVTLHNHFIVKFSELLDSHHKATVQALNAAFQDVHTGLSNDTQAIVSQLRTKTIENTLATVGEHQRVMGQFLESVTALLKQARLYALASAVCLLFSISLVFFVK